MRKLIVIIVLVLFLVAFEAVSISVSARHQLDTDGDGIPDRWEIDHGLNPYDPSDANLDYNYDNLTNLEEYKKRWDPWDTDTDDDGISNYAEFTGLFAFFSDPTEKDTDDDGLDDLKEICRYIDTDNQTQMDEIYPKKDNRGWVIDKLRKLREDYPYELDPLNPDVDGDGLDDGDEIKHDTSPNTIDWDLDGLTDGDEVHEYKTKPTERDMDEDGLTDYEEIFGTYGYVTDPKKWDTNGDGKSDGEEFFGFGFAPIPPSEHALTYEEFISGNAYADEYITMKAKVDKIKIDAGADLKSYRIFLKPLSGTSVSGNRAIVKVKNRYHYDFEHDSTFIDDRFDITLKEGDTVVIVGEAGKFEGSTRNLVVNGKGKIYLLLSLAERSTRWVPSAKYVKVMYPVVPMVSPTPTPTLTPTPITSPTPLPSPTLTPSPTPSPSPTAEVPGFPAPLCIGLSLLVYFYLTLNRNYHNRNRKL
jgi:hypothetical protein